MKVFVLGHKGMLGHVVSRYLREQGHTVLQSEARFDGEAGDPLVEAVRASGADWVVNALGKIWQKCRDPHALFLANSILPHQLKASLKPHQKLIHASTDCVFSGKRGRYSVDDEPDAEDSYGVSKRLAELVAERGKAIVVRCSVIGPETRDRAGLFAWFLSQRGPVDGYTTHLWNGISTLEWAKVCAELVSGRLVPSAPLLQPAIPETVSKFDLLSLLAERWSPPVTLRPQAPEKIDRTLVPTHPRLPLREQLDELKAWYKNW